MRRWLIGLGTAALLTLGAAAPTLADGPTGTARKDNQQAYHSGNCVAVYSAQVTHNGQVVRDQAQSGQRSDLVHQAHVGSGRRLHRGRRFGHIIGIL